MCNSVPQEIGIAEFTLFSKIESENNIWLIISLLFAITGRAAYDLYFEGYTMRKLEFIV